MVESEEVENSGPEIVNSAGIFGGVIAEFVGGAVDMAAFDATAGHPDGKAVRVVVAAVIALGEGSAAEFSSPDDEGVFEEAAGLEVLDECGDGLADLVAHFTVAFFEIAVVIPWVGAVSATDVVGEGGQFDEANAAFDEAAGEEALASVGGLLGLGVVEAIEFFGEFGFAGEVAEFGNGRLHAPCEFVVADGSLNLRVGVDSRGEALVEGVDEIEFAALKVGGFAGFDVADSFALVGADD